MNKWISLATIDPVAFHLGPWPVYWYGVIIGLGMLAGYGLYIQEVKRKGMDQEAAFDMMFWAIIIGFVCARIYYVVFSWDDYRDDWLSVFAIWQGGIAIYGGVIGGALTVVHLTRQKLWPLALSLDIAAPALMLAQAIGRWGNFINQEAHGEAIERARLEALHLPDFVIEQMKIEGQYYQPTFLYESVWNLLGLGIICFLRRRKGWLIEGEVALFYLVWYGIGRAYIEGLRTDSFYWGPVRVSQALSLILVVVSLGVAVYRRQNRTLPAYTASDQQ